MKSSEVLNRAVDGLFKQFERRRTAPFHRSHRKTINDMVMLRDTIRDEQNLSVKEFLEYCSQNSSKSYSQLFQDLFVDYVLNGKQNGFFCEFGATNGVSLSNTFYLENERGWTGICAEPALGWHKQLVTNRPNSIIDTRCVWSHSGQELAFSESDARSLSSLTSYTDSDRRGGKRRNGVSYTVNTVSLTDLLIEHNAPKDLDFISIDTEGSELEILSTFDFQQFQPKVFAIEHNFLPIRDDIRNLMKGHGYRRVLTECSQWDDWYLVPSVNLPQ